MTQDWRGLVAVAAHRLEDAGVDSPRADAEWLAAAVAGVSRAGLTVAADASRSQMDRFAEMVERRAAREPLQHILGSAGFRYLDVRVGPGVFIPRPETESLVEWALEVLRPVESPIVVDLCAGSGAIGLSVAHERRDATVYLVEQSIEAIVWLRHNVTTSNVTIVEGDVTAASTLSSQDGRCDAVLANPPYVPRGTAVSPEVARDPDVAVFAGADGLDVIRGLVPRAAGLARPGAVVAVEHDDSHGEVVPELLRANGFTEVEDHLDLAGRPRFATGRRGD